MVVQLVEKEHHEPQGCEFIPDGVIEIYH